MIYEFREKLEDFFKASIHFFRAMFCRDYKNDECKINRKYCRYWNCPKK